MADTVEIKEGNGSNVVTFLKKYGIKNIYIEGDMVCINKGVSAPSSGPDAASEGGASAEASSGSAEGKKTEPSSDSAEGKKTEPSDGGSGSGGESSSGDESYEATRPSPNPIAEEAAAEARRREAENLSPVPNVNEIKTDIERENAASSDTTSSDAASSGAEVTNPSVGGTKKRKKKRNKNKTAKKKK